MEELGFEDREIVLQVLAAASDEMTKRQLQCLLLCGWAGATQQQAGDALGISQVMVHKHFAGALEKVKAISPGGLY